MKAAKFFSICEIVCFVGLALSYAGEFLCAFVAQGTDKDIFQMGLFLFWLLIGPLAICNLICAAVMYRRLSDPAVRQTLWRCIIAMKCIAIPMFLLNFFFGMIYADFPDDAAGRALTNAGCLVCHDGLVRLLHCAHPARAQAGQNQHRNRSPAGHFPIYLRC